jgi:hypothetical protein
MEYNLPKCMDRVGKNTYRCRISGTTLVSIVPPVRCPRCLEDTPSLPPISKQAVNFGKAVVKRILSGLKNVTEEEYQARLNICNECPLRSGINCSVCGCPIAKKARWATEDCPKSFWPKLQ